MKTMTSVDSEDSAQQRDARHLRRTQHERSEATRGHLIQAAIACVHELGFAGATLAVIAERAGVTRGAVQHHFGNRNDLMLALITEIGDRLSIRADAGLALRPLKDRIAAVCDQYWDIISSARSVAAIHIQLGTKNDPDLHPRIVEAIRKAEERLDRQWVELFADQDSPAERIAAVRHIVLASMRGFALKQVHGLDPDEWHRERMLLQEMVERIIFA